MMIMNYLKFNFDLNFKIILNDNIKTSFHHLKLIKSNLRSFIFWLKILVSLLTNKYLRITQIRYIIGFKNFIKLNLGIWFKSKLQINLIGLNTELKYFAVFNFYAIR